MYYISERSPIRGRIHSRPPGLFYSICFPTPATPMNICHRSYVRSFIPSYDRSAPSSMSFN